LVSSAVATPHDDYRAQTATLARQILESDDPYEAAMALFSFALGRHGKAPVGLGAMYEVWGAITDEWTRPDGDAGRGARLACEAATELVRALGDEAAEGAWSTRWHERLCRDSGPSA
jgi:hypothetical protein